MYIWKHLLEIRLSQLSIKGLNQHHFILLTVQLSWLSTSLPVPTFFCDTVKNAKAIYSAESLWLLDKHHRSQSALSIDHQQSVIQGPEILSSPLIKSQAAPHWIFFFRMETMLREPQRAIHQPWRLSSNAVEKSPSPCRPAETRLCLQCYSAESLPSGVCTLTLHSKQNLQKYRWAYTHEREDQVLWSYFA